MNKHVDMAKDAVERPTRLMANRIISENNNRYRPFSEEGICGRPVKRSDHGCDIELIPEMAAGNYMTSFLAHFFAKQYNDLTRWQKVMFYFFGKEKKKVLKLSQKIIINEQKYIKT